MERDADVTDIEASASLRRKRASPAPYSMKLGYLRLVIIIPTL